MKAGKGTPEKGGPESLAAKDSSKDPLKRVKAGAKNSPSKVRSPKSKGSAAVASSVGDGAGAGTSPEASEAGATGEARPKRSEKQIAELKERLAAKIRTLREQRKAVGTGVPGAPRNREAILEARRAKERHRRDAAAEADAVTAGASTGVSSGASTKRAPRAVVKVEDSEESAAEADELIFSKVQREGGDDVAVGATIGAASKKRKKGPSDLLGQLKHVEAKKARLATMEKEKRELIEVKDKWKRAIKQAEGEKVRDDEKMLRKSLKKQRKRKKKSERDWKDREENVKKGIKARIHKREANIAARKEAKKAGKSATKAKPAKRRPGFEGGNKRKRT
ncbi:surfeit locus protein 6-domain-containing protein [Dipodascopsis tothii]|uniref:surfeit locus protein 6-domain-containing protein n=1 Tax=Dipodascopsis tothii TaxID=44089 RepID=UPI0034CDBFF0